MNTRFHALLTALVPLTFLLAGCGATEEYRYKTTVEVETPVGIRSGYSVREIRHYTPPPIPMLGESRPTWSVQGEAVAVDIAPGKTLFATLDGATGDFEYAGRHIDFLLAENDKKRGGILELFPAMPKLRSPRIDNMLPMFIIFRDLGDPMQIERIDPHDLSNKLGDGMRLRRVTIEVTKEGVTNKIENILPWMRQIDKYRSDPDNPFTNTLPREIGGLQRGFKK